MKVSGTIDNYNIDSINLFTISGQDKLISVNEKIRKAINKRGGDTVTVTLYLLSTKEHITEKDILATFKESGVLDAFKQLTADEQKEIIRKIAAATTEEKQINLMLTYIDQLAKSHD